MKKLQNNNKGFTIIEVLIVLAIAGLILLIVFLAVPALQRNSRNTQRKNQAATYTGAISEWVNNHNGTTPTTTDHVTEINNNSADGQMTEPSAAPTDGASTTPLELDQMEIAINARCVDSGNTEAANGNRSIALRYTIEDSSGDPVGQCQNI